MRLPEEILTLAGTAKTDWLWEHTLLATEDTDQYEKELRKIRTGYHLKFNIQYIVNENYIEDIKNNKVIINQYKYDLEEFWEEMELRKTNMRKIIYENIQEEEGIDEPRIK